MDKRTIIIGGVRAAEFKIEKLIAHNPVINNLVLITLIPKDDFKPDHMPRRVIKKADYKFNYAISDKITWRGFMLHHGKLIKVYLYNTELFTEKQLTYEQNCNYHKRH